MASAIFLAASMGIASAADLIHSPMSLPEIDQIADGATPIPIEVFSKYDSDSIGRAIVRLVQRRNHGKPAPATFYVPKEYADRYFEYQIRVPREKLESVIKKGLENLIQTGTSMGWGDIETRLFAESPHWQLPFEPGVNGTQTRSMREQIARLGGVGEATLLETLPKYGYITSPLAPCLTPQIPNFTAHYTHDVKQYGDVILVLKPAAKSRMTHYPGDSLAAPNNDLFRAVEEGPVSTIHLEMRQQATPAALYLEFQIFGKVTLDDVAEIRIPPVFDEKYLNVLKKTGIPITQYSPLDWKGGYRRGKVISPGKFPLPTEPPPETEALRREMTARFARFLAAYNKGPRYILQGTSTDMHERYIQLAQNDVVSPPEAKKELLTLAFGFDPSSIDQTLAALKSLPIPKRGSLFEAVTELAPHLPLNEKQRGKLFKWIRDSMPPGVDPERGFRKFLLYYSGNGGGPIGKLTATGEASTGYTGGVWVRDELGIKWFLKRDLIRPELQTSAEVISSQIYRALGYKAPTIAITRWNGKRYAAVRSMGENLKFSVDLGNINTPELRQLRVVAAYLKDWDRTHVGPNNVDLGHGDFELFDFGGTLGSSARGKPKPGPVQSSAIGGFGAQEWQLDDIIGGYKIDHLPADHPWNHITPEDVAAVAKKFAALSDETIMNAVVKARYTRPADTQTMAKALEMRRNTLADPEKLIQYFRQKGVKEFLGGNCSAGKIAQRLRKNLGAP